MIIPLFILTNTPLALLATFMLLYIFYVQMKLYNDIVEKCHDIVETNKVPTNYYRKKLYYYTDYPFMGIMLLFIPAIIIGLSLMITIII